MPVRYDNKAAFPRCGIGQGASGENFGETPPPEDPDRPGGKVWAERLVTGGPLLVVAAEEMQTEA